MSRGAVEASCDPDSFSNQYNIYNYFCLIRTFWKIPIYRNCYNRKREGRKDSEYNAGTKHLKLHIETLSAY